MAGRPKRAEDLARLDLEVGLADRVWDMLDCGIAFSRICDATGLAKQSLLEWIDSGANAERAALARTRAARALADETVEIADLSGEAKLRIQTRQWTAERFDRRTYGQKVEHEVTGSITHQHLAALQTRNRPALAQADVVDAVPKTLEQQLLEL